MTTSLLNLVDEVLATLRSNVGDAEERTHLTQDLGSSVLTGYVNDGSQVSQGLIQVDDELLWVSQVDRNANTFTVEPYGRGYNMSTAASHTAGAPVINNPRFPRERVRATLRQVLEQIYPDVFVVKTDTSQTFNAAQLTYPVPADCDFVLSVSWQTVGPSGLYLPIKRYRLDRMADTAVYPTGRTIDIDPMASPMPGRKLKLGYIAAPSGLTTDATTLADIGLKESVRDILVWGTCARLLQAEEATRVASGTVETTARDTVVPAGSASNAAKAFYGMFAQRLQDEGDQLRRIYPVVAHTSW